MLAVQANDGDGAVDVVLELRALLVGQPRRLSRGLAGTAVRSAITVRSAPPALQRRSRHPG